MRLLIFSLILVSSTLSGQDGFLDDFISKWKGSKAFTLEVAQIMPDSLYDYKPVEEEMTFKRVLIHLIQNMRWISRDYLGAGDFDHDLKNADPSKDELLSLIALAYDHSTKALENLKPHRLRQRAEFFAGETTVRKMMMLMSDHATHHRGQLSVYLRMNNIKPPRYRGW